MSIRLLSRFPDKQSVTQLFATAAFIVYGWTLYTSFNKVPSWLFYLKLNEIFSIYAYSFFLNFLESLSLTFVFVLAGFFLYGNLWKDRFLPAGMVMVIVTVGSALVHMHLYESPDLRVSFINSQLRWWLVTVLVALVASFISVRVTWFMRLLENLADRLTVFLYIYIPLTVLSLVIILVRIVV